LGETRGQACAGGDEKTAGGGKAGNKGKHGSGEWKAVKAVLLERKMQREETGIKQYSPPIDLTRGRKGTTLPRWRFSGAVQYSAKLYSLSDGSEDKDQGGKKFRPNRAGGAFQ